MNQREVYAHHLEKDKDSILKMLKKSPVEITSHKNCPERERLRAVIDSPEKFELLLEQLRAEYVGPEIALNPTLITTKR
jgi:hypothetical protein